MADFPFRRKVGQLLSMLNEGRVIEAIDLLYAPEAQIYENEFLFAEKTTEAIERHRPFFDNCTRYTGQYEILHLDDGRRISVFRNTSDYCHREFGDGRINGVHVFYWHQDFVTREEYFSHQKAEEAIAFWKGIRQASLG